MMVSARLAAVTTTASGSPPPSQTRWSLDPGLPRSTGFAPTWSPAFGAHAHGVHARPRPVQPALRTQPIQDLQVEPVKHAGVGPLGQAAPAGRRRAAPEFLGRQQPPGSRGPGHVHDRREAVAVGDGPAPASIRRPRWNRQQGLEQSHSSLGTRSSTRMVMARDPARLTPKERNDVQGVGANPALEPQRPRTEQYSDQGQPPRDQPMACGEGCSTARCAWDEPSAEARGVGVRFGLDP